uniref:Uncharacterized protein n=1 Tax=Caenorhabditis tropicalis TaxID=1561998 RepID=A0A1I7TKZ4_9PELO
MTLHHHGSAERKSVDDYSDIPRGDACKQLVEQMNRTLYSLNANIQNTFKQMVHIETRWEFWEKMKIINFEQK